MCGLWKFSLGLEAELPSGFRETWETESHVGTLEVSAPPIEKWTHLGFSFAIAVLNMTFWICEKVSRPATQPHLYTPVGNAALIFSLASASGPRTWYVQGRINHCADCTMGGAPSPGAPDQLPNILRRRLGINVTTTIKKVVTFLREKCTPEKILATRMRKGPPPYVGMGPPNG